MPVTCGNGEVEWGGGDDKKGPFEKEGGGGKCMPGWPHRLAASAECSHPWEYWGSSSLQPNGDVSQVHICEHLQGCCDLYRGWFSPDTGDPKEASAQQQQKLYVISKPTFVSFSSTISP